MSMIVFAKIQQKTKKPSSIFVSKKLLGSIDMVVLQDIFMYKIRINYIKSAGPKR